MFVSPSLHRQASWTDTAAAIQDTFQSLLCHLPTPRGSMPPKRGKKQKKPEDHGSDNDSSSDFASALSLQHIEMSPSSASPSTKKTRVADASTSAAGLGLGLAEVAANKVTVKTAELLFTCEFCPRAFGTPSALSAHQRVHKAKPEVAIHPYRVHIDMLHPCSR